MTWTILLTPSAARSLRRLDPQIRQHVVLAFEQLAVDPFRGKLLHFDLEGLRSWRTGEFRIIYRLIKDRLEIHVVALGHRRDVYERLRRNRH